MADDRDEIIALLRSIEAKLDVCGQSGGREGLVGAEATEAIAFGDDDRISVVVAANPKRPGTASFERFELYRHIRTVRGYLLAGVGAGYLRSNLRADLRWDTEHDFIRIEKAAASEGDKTS